MSKADTGGVLSDKYTFPAFSVLDMASGECQEIEREWMARGIKSDEGRDDNLLNYSEMIRGKELSYGTIARIAMS